ncbi:MAG TPA: NAD(P)H-quinone oxidoreductase [Burkholderiaceae bacterium]|nr:NAD(P)H-quinone oxidoreductase [Burkholderiaceae bacterium]
MKVFEITSFGTSDVLRTAVRATPVAAAGEVLIRVHASGVNRPDVLQRAGHYPAPAGASDIPGLEIAGIIEGGDLAALAVAGMQVGDSVCALVAGGGYSEFCVAPVAQCLPIPKGLNFIEAASLPETFFTVWSNVFERARLQDGETFLVHGGTSGIGVTAIQMAKSFGSVVIATAGSDEKCAACLALGADHAINYKTQDFVAEVNKITHDKGVDVILDMVAGNYVAREMTCLADDGRLVIIAVQGGVDSGFHAGMLMRKRLSITGSTLRARPIAFKAQIAQALRAKVWPLLENGKVKAVVHKVYSASRGDAAAQAHALMETNTHIGKLVLDWQT